MGQTICARCQRECNTYEKMFSETYEQSGNVFVDSYTLDLSTCCDADILEEEIDALDNTTENYLD